MVEISKPLFDERCRDISCHILVHPWGESCVTSALLTYKYFLIGSIKFYAMVYMAQIAVRGKKMLKKEEWLKMGRYYLRSILIGTIGGSSCVTTSCAIRALLGNKFTYYTYVGIPSTLGAAFICMEPPYRRGLLAILFCDLVIEYWMRTLERAGYLDITATKQTLMFMIGSSLLFYLMRLEGDKKKRTHLVWLFTPEKVRRETDESENVCPHNGPCQKHIFKGFATYFGVGFAFTMAKQLLPRISTPLKALSTIRTRHLKLAMFFGSYIGIYRAVICYLCREQGVDLAMYALPAGFLAGLSFLFSPKLGYSIASLTAAAKLCSTILYEKKILPEYIPLTDILFCLCQGILFHARHMHGDVCPAHVKRVLSSISNGGCDLFYKNLLEVAGKATV